MKLLVGIDGSSAAQAALDLIRTLDWPAGTAARIVQVVEVELDLYGLPAPVEMPVPDLETPLLRAAETTLDAAAHDLGGAPFTVETAVLRGRPADSLLQEAARVGADLIVVGSRGHGTLDAMLLGSVSAEVVSRSRVPVLVVRGTSADQVVLAYDGSPAAEAAAHLVETLPVLRRAQVRVATVIDRGPWWSTVPPLVPAEALVLFEDAWEAAQAKARATVHAAATRLQESGIATDEAILDGDPGAELIHAIRRWNADLVILGAHGRHGLAGIIPGSVARTLVLHAPASVLVVPPPAPAPAEPAFAAWPPEVETRSGAVR
ncbi:MAG TPA: universal stress protein [Candidatus Limnocylindrales bacterium]